MLMLVAEQSSNLVDSGIVFCDNTATTATTTTTIPGDTKAQKPVLREDMHETIVSEICDA